MATHLEASLDYCRRLTRREAGNFYFSFLTLPRAKRDAMCAIYSWMRRLDDRADDAPSPAQARLDVQQWLSDTHKALDRSSSDFAADPPSVWPAFADTVHRYAIPPSHFDEIAEGALMDQEITRYAAFEDLYRYCYRVASLVGLVSLRVFEYDDPKAEQNGEALGIAFQLTNILRDVREDAARNRIYIPHEDLRRFGVAEDDLLRGRWSWATRELFESFADRAERYYARAQPVAGQVSKEARPTLRIMTEIYHGILGEIRKKNYRVFDHRARLPTWKKMAIVVKHQLLPKT